MTKYYWSNNGLPISEEEYKKIPKWKRFVLDTNHCYGVFGTHDFGCPLYKGNYF